MADEITLTALRAATDLMECVRGTGFMARTKVYRRRRRMQQVCSTEPYVAIMQTVFQSNVSTDDPVASYYVHGIHKFKFAPVAAGCFLF